VTGAANDSCFATVTGDQWPVELKEVLSVKCYVKKKTTQASGFGKKNSRKPQAVRQ
jgi:hypothetical protein